MFIMILKILCTGILGYVVVAVGLIVFQSPQQVSPASDEGLDFSKTIAQNYENLPPLQAYKTRNADQLQFRKYASSIATDRIVILVHGSGWHGMQFHTLAQALAKKGVADIIVPDLRGHGENPIRRGDVDYVGQLEDDLADLIAHVSQDGSKIILAGHSSGGGLAIRFAGGTHAHLADAYVLLAPFLKHDAPTTRPNSGGWAHPAIARIIGLSMLNNIGVRVFNYLPIISFAMPQSVLNGPLGHTATTTYSYRLNVSFSPRDDYQTDIAALTNKFLLLAGSQDESFIASAYEEVMAPLTDAGTYQVLDGVNHLGLVSDDQAISAIGNWLDQLD